MTLNSKLLRDIESAQRIQRELKQTPLGYPSWVDEMVRRERALDYLKNLQPLWKTPIFHGIDIQKSFLPPNLGQVLEGFSIGQERARILAEVRGPSALSDSILGSSTALNRIAEQLAAVKVSPVGVGLLNSSSISMHNAVTRALDLSLAGETAFAALDPERLGGRFAVSSMACHRLELRFQRQVGAFAALQSGIEGDILDFTAHLPVLTKLPATGLFTHADVLRVTSEPEGEEDEPTTLRAEVAGEIADALPLLLEGLDSRLVKMWLGARDSMRSGNPDRVRHVIVSLRTLFDHVFWTLAPDGAVTTWTQDPQDYHNGRLTRSARVRYICRTVNYGPLTSYVKKSIAALLEFYDLFGGGTHGADDRFTDEQLSVILTHAEGHLRFLIEVSRSKSA